MRDEYLRALCECRTMEFWHQGGGCTVQVLVHHGRRWRLDTRAETSEDGMRAAGWTLDARVGY